MRRHLYAKFLLGYLIFGVLSFLTIAFFSAHLTEKYLTQSTGEKLYTEATLLADACSIPYSGSGPDMESAEPAMQSTRSVKTRDQIFFMENSPSKRGNRFCC